MLSTSILKKGALAAAAAASTLTGAAAIPAAASAHDYGYYGCDSSRSTATGAAVGGVAGALIGSGVAGRHDRGGGALLGGVLGALAGAAVGHNESSCRRTYGYGGYTYPAYQGGYYGRGYSYGGYAYPTYQAGYYGRGYGYRYDRGYDDRGRYGERYRGYR